MSIENVVKTEVHAGQIDGAQINGDVTIDRGLYESGALGIECRYVNGRPQEPYAHASAEAIEWYDAARGQ